MNSENHLFGAPAHRLSPSPPARVDLATPGTYTIQDATETTEPPPSAPAINTKQYTADAGAAATGGAPPDILASARSGASAAPPHTGHQDLPPEDSFTTTNTNTAKIVGRRGSAVLPLARDDDTMSTKKKISAGLVQVRLWEESHVGVGGEGEGQSFLIS